MTPPDCTAGPPAPSVLAASPTPPRGDVAAPGLPTAGPPTAGRPGAQDSAPVAPPPAAGAGQAPAAGTNVAARDGKPGLPRPAAGSNDEAAQRREAQRAAWKAAQTARNGELRRRVLRPRRGGSSAPGYLPGGNRRMPPGGDAA
jgi:hypothetical protein